MNSEVKEKEVTNEETDTSVKRCYTVADVMEMLQISKPTALKLVKEGPFHSFQIGVNKAWRVSKKGFDEWLDSQN